MRLVPRAVADGILSTDLLQVVQVSVGRRGRILKLPAQDAHPVRLQVVEDLRVGAARVCRVKARLDYHAGEILEQPAHHGHENQTFELVAFDRLEELAF